MSLEFCIIPRPDTGVELLARAHSFQEFQPHGSYPSIEEALRAASQQAGQPLALSIFPVIAP